MKAYQHILLTTNFSEFSQEVAQKAISLAGHFNAQITLLHVVENILEDESIDLVSSEGVDPNSGYINDLIDKQRNRLMLFTQSIQNFDPIHLVTFTQTSAEDEISKVAGELKADLIIIGAHGDNGVSVLPTFNLEAVKQKVSCDVLVVHAEVA